MNIFVAEPSLTMYSQNCLCTIIYILLILHTSQLPLYLTLGARISYMQHVRACKEDFQQERRSGDIRLNPLPPLPLTEMCTMFRCMFKDVLEMLRHLMIASAGLCCIYAEVNTYLHISIGLGAIVKGRHDRGSICHVSD